MRVSISYIIVFVAAMLTTGCAKQGMPSGGPKDVTPPKTLRTTPENRSMGFTGDQFYVEFDEYVVLKDAENNILVSPPMATKPEYKTKGKGVLVKIKDTLQPNTTYLFQFKNAIADYNEGNLLPSMEYVFSTGSYIDSMSISGRVVDALTFEPREDAISVWLMSAADGESFMATYGDSAAPAPTLAYTTRCDKDGTFRFNYIRPGQYSIFAVCDENKNNQIDAGEAMAFRKESVEALIMNDSTADSTAKPVADTGGVRLLLFAPKTAKQRITGSDFTAAGKVRITSLMPMNGPAIDCGGKEVVWRFNATRDTLTLWTMDKKCDSLHITISDATGIEDTLRLRWRPKKSLATSKPQSDMKLNFTKLPYYETLVLLFGTPLATGQETVDSAVCITRLKDSIAIYCPVFVDSSLLKARIGFDFSQGEKYGIKITQGRIKNIYGIGNDSLQTTVEVTKTEDYGNLSVKVTPVEPMLPGFAVVQLLNEKGNAVASKRVFIGIETAKFQHLTPGKYRVRAIVDSNGNGEWDTGDFRAMQQPEKVIYLPKTLDVRANWDFEETIEIGD